MPLKTIYIRTSISGRRELAAAQYLMKKKDFSEILRDQCGSLGQSPIKGRVLSWQIRLF